MVNRHLRGRCYVGASVLEVAMVVESRYDDVVRPGFDKWLESSAVEALVVTGDRIEIARDSAVLAKAGTRRH